MSTTSTAPEVLDGLLQALNNGQLSGVKVYETWPGPEAAAEMIVLGDVEWDDYAIATIKAGRKHRQEDYNIGFEVFVAGEAGTTPASPKTARDRAFAVLADLEDALADDVTAGTAFTTVQYVEIRPTEAAPFVFEKGWAYRVAGQFEVHARLL